MHIFCFQFSINPLKKKRKEHKSPYLQLLIVLFGHILRAVNCWKILGYKVNNKFVSEFLIHDLLSRHNFTKQKKLHGESRAGHISVLYLYIKIERKQGSMDKKISSKKNLMKIITKMQQAFATTNQQLTIIAASTKK